METPQNILQDYNKVNNNNKSKHLWDRNTCRQPYGEDFIKNITSELHMGTSLDLKRFVKFNEIVIYFLLNPVH